MQEKAPGSVGKITGETHNVILVMFSFTLLPRMTNVPLQRVTEGEVHAPQNRVLL